MKAEPTEHSGAERTRRRRIHEAEGGVVGALTGASLGALAGGPAGAVAGAAIGAAIGGVTAWTIDANGVDASEHDRQLDDDIGVTRGDLGTPNLEHPPAKFVAPSAAASGAAGADGGADAAGPISSPPE